MLSFSARSLNGSVEYPSVNRRMRDGRFSGARARTFSRARDVLVSVLLPEYVAVSEFGICSTTSAAKSR